MLYNAGMSHKVLQALQQGQDGVLVRLQGVKPVKMLGLLTSGGKMNNLKKEET